MRFCELNLAISLIDVILIAVIMDLAHRPLNRGPLSLARFLPCRKKLHQAYQRFGLTDNSTVVVEAVSNNSIQATEIHQMAQENNSSAIAPFNWMRLAICLDKIGFVVNIVVYTITAASLFS